jgi:hypothetical protein
MHVAMQVQQYIFVFNQPVEVLGSTINWRIKLESAHWCLVVKRPTVCQVNSLFILVLFLRKYFCLFTVFSKRLVRIKWISLPYLFSCFLIQIAWYRSSKPDYLQTVWNLYSSLMNTLNLTLNHMSFFVVNKRIVIARDKVHFAIEYFLNLR